MSHWISLVTKHGRINAWESAPEDKPNGGVVLVHDLFGMNDDIVRIAGRYSDAGYLTLLPALFDNIQRDVEMDYTPQNEKIGAALSEQLGSDLATELVVSAVEAIAHAGNLAIVGYGWGGAIALRAAKELQLPCVSYYNATGLPRHWQARAPTRAILHYGRSHDAFADELFALQQGGSFDLEAFSYPAGPFFDRPAHPSDHHAESADLALRRTLGFLRQQIFQSHD